MAGSRLERIGTIFTRMTGLLQSRAVPYEERPLWYDVYKAFPPALPPKYDRPAPQTTLKNIFYPEDLIRVKFHKYMGRRLQSLNLSDKQNENITRRMIALCTDFQNNKNMSVEEAFDSALDVLKADGSIKSKSSRPSQMQSKSDDSIVNSFKEVTGQRSDEKLPQQVDIKSLFKDDK